MRLPEVCLKGLDHPDRSHALLSMQAVQGYTEKSDQSFLGNFRDLTVMSMISVALLGFDQRSKDRLTYILDKRAADICCTSDTQQPDVAIFDLDNERSLAQIDGFQHEQPLTPIIAVCAQRHEIPNVVHLEKPFQISDLIELIQELAVPPASNRITDDKVAQAMQALDAKRAAASLSKRLDGAKSQSRASRPLANVSTEMCFNPERFLLGRIQAAFEEAQAKSKTALVTCWGDKAIVIPPRSELPFYTNLKDKHIRNLAIAPLDDQLSSPVTVEFVEPSASRLKSLIDDVKLEAVSGELFLWNLAVLTCRGRVPAEFSTTERYYLRRWPNLTRINVPPSALPVLALWSSQTSSISEIKERLDVPVQNILSVFTAAYFAGLAGKAQRRSDMILEPEIPKDNQQRDLLSMIMRRLEKFNKRQLQASA